MNQPVLEARDLVVARDKRMVLDIPSLQFHPGEVVAIIGPNGSGKSTLLLSLLALLSPARGEIRFGGKSIRGSFTRHDSLSAGELGRISPTEYRRQTATVFQEPLLLDTSVEQNVATGLRLRGAGGQDIRQRVSEWLERFGIAHLAKRRARTLSGGEAQRASLARAFVLQPQILFMDEPFAALDAPTKAAILEDVESVIKETGVTAVFVTHDRNEALALGDRIGVLMGGRIQQLDSAAAVFHSPVSEEVAAFVGVETVAPGIVRSCDEGLVRIDAAGHLIEAIGDYLPGQRVLVCLRPEDITLSTVVDGRSTSARNRLNGMVAKLSPSGPLVRVVVDCGFTLVAAITRQSAADLGLAAGQVVEASFKASALHVIRK